MNRFFKKKKKPSRSALLLQLQRMHMPIENYVHTSDTHLQQIIKKNLKTYLERIFDKRIRDDLLPAYTHSSLRMPGRNRCHLVGSKLEYDFSWLSLKIAVEIQGGIDCHSRRSGHLSRNGIRRDMQKVCLSSIQGWILLQLSPEQVYDNTV